MTEQLRMFMTPAEILSERRVNGNEIEDEDYEVAGYDTWDGDFDYDDPDVRGAAEEAMWSRKLDEAYDDGTYDSIEEEGVRSPIALGPERIGNGHHRIATANNLNPHQFVPVMHYSFDSTALRAGFGFTPDEEEYSRWSRH